MKLIIISVLVLLCVISKLEAKDLVVGSRVNNLLVSTDKVVYNGIPLIRRDKDYTYTDPKQRIIKAIIVRDRSRTNKAEAMVTAGGVGATHVTINLKSERGEGLNFLILIFSQNS